jgi:hypothetical protein
MIKFSSFIYKDKPVSEKTCSLWEMFTAYSSYLPFPNVEIATMNMVTLDKDLISNEVTSVNATCNDRNSVSFMVDKMSKSVPFLVSCGGFSWRFFKCSVSFVFCINCKRDCGLCSGEALINHPCAVSKCVTNTASASVVSLVIKEKIMYPEYSSPIRVVGRSKSSVTLNLNVTKLGSVYCVALPNNQIPLFARSIVTAGSYVFVERLSRDGFNLTLSQLPPDSLLNVYCYTESFVGQGMPMRSVIDSSVSVRTECCRDFQLSTKYVSITESESYEFSLSVSSAVTTPCVVNLTSSRPSAVMFSPNNFAVVSIDNDPKRFLLTAYESGIFNITASAFECSDNIKLATFVLVVRSAEEPPPAPLIESVVLADDGMSIFMSFDASTDKGGNYLFE